MKYPGQVAGAYNEEGPEAEIIPLYYNNGTRGGGRGPCILSPINNTRTCIHHSYRSHNSRLNMYLQTHMSHVSYLVF